MTRLLFITLGFVSLAALGFAQEKIKAKKETQISLKKLGAELAAAQKSENEDEVKRLMQHGPKESLNLTSWPLS